MANAIYPVTRGQSFQVLKQLAIYCVLSVFIAACIVSHTHIHDEHAHHEESGEECSLCVFAELPQNPTTVANLSSTSVPKKCCSAVPYPHMTFDVFVITHQMRAPPIV